MKTAAASRYLLFPAGSPRASSGSGSAVSSGTHTGSLFPLCLPWTLLSTFHLVPSWLQNDLQLHQSIPSEKEGMDIDEFSFHEERIIHWNYPKSYPFKFHWLKRSHLTNPHGKTGYESVHPAKAVIGSDCYALGFRNRHIVLLNQISQQQGQRQKGGLFYFLQSNMNWKLWGSFFRLDCALS